MGLLLVMLGIKLIFERMSKLICDKGKAERVLAFVYLGVLAYELNLRLALSVASHWLLVVEVVGFDVVENVYLLLCLERQCKAQMAGACSSGREQIKRTIQFMICSLVLREFIEILTPCSSSC